MMGNVTQRQGRREQIKGLRQRCCRKTILKIVEDLNRLQAVVLHKKPVKATRYIQKWRLKCRQDIVLVLLSFLENIKTPFSLLLPRKMPRKQAIGSGFSKKKKKKHIPAVIVNFTPRTAKYDVPKLSSNAINLVMKDVQYQFLSIFFFILTSFLGKKKTNLLCKCISIQENNYTKKKLLPRLITSYKPSRYKEIVQNYNTSFRLNHNH